MPTQMSSLVEFVILACWVFGLSGFVVIMWYRARPHFGSRFWPIFAWSHVIGFPIGIGVPVITVAIDQPMEEVWGAAFCGILVAVFLSYFIGALLLLRMRNQQEKCQENHALKH